jgi:hypothetical protein
MSVFYHGGQGGLMIGSYLLPPSVTGVKTNLDYLKSLGIDRSADVNDTEEFLREYAGITGIWRPDRVYLGGPKVLHYIFGYAALNTIASYREGNGAVYGAIPEGEVNVFCMGDWMRSIGLGSMVKQSHDNYVRVECERAMVYNIIAADVDESYADRFQARPAYITRAINDALAGTIDKRGFVSRYRRAKSVPALNDWDDSRLIPPDVECMIDA